MNKIKDHMPSEQELKQAIHLKQKNKILNEISNYLDQLNLLCDPDHSDVQIAIQSRTNLHANAVYLRTDWLPLGDPSALPLIPVVPT